MDNTDSKHLVALSADVMAAYVSFNNLDIAEIPGLIQAIFGSLSQPGTTIINEPPKKQKPAVLINKSITPDFIICLEDGRKYKSLKRHLLMTYQMTPNEYRAKWGLPKDYPMVAPSYSALRSNLAKELGLGFGDAAAKSSRRGRAKVKA
jgi:predicted transcriptional regulator